MKNLCKFSLTTSVCLFTILSCTRTITNVSTTFIDMESALDSANVFTLDDMGYTPTFVPLETSDSCMVGAFPHIVIWKEKIILSSQGQNSIKVFDKNNGRLLNHIGRVGQGPGEYQYSLYPGFLPFWVDYTNGTVYVNTNLVYEKQTYDITGKYRGKFIVDTTIVRPSSVNGYFPFIDADTVILHNKLRHADRDFYLAYFDGFTGTLIDKIPPLTGIGITTIPKEVFVLAGLEVGYGSQLLYLFNYSTAQQLQVAVDAPTIWKYDNQLYFKDNYVDTIYTIQNGNLLPKVTLHLGNYHWSYKERTNTSSSTNWANINYIYENDQVLFFHLMNGCARESKPYCGFYNKLTYQTRMMSGDSIRLHSTSDISIRIAGISSTGELYAIVQPDQLIGLSEIANYPMLKQLQEDDNPILVICKPKEKNLKVLKE